MSGDRDDDDGGDYCGTVILPSSLLFPAPPSDCSAHRMPACQRLVTEVIETLLIQHYDAPAGRGGQRLGGCSFLRERMALRFGNGDAPPTVPKRDAVAHGEESAQPCGREDRARMPAASGVFPDCREAQE